MGQHRQLPPRPPDKSVLHWTSLAGEGHFFGGEAEGKAEWAGGGCSCCQGVLGRRDLDVAVRALVQAAVAHWTWPAKH